MSSGRKSGSKGNKQARTRQTATKAKYPPERRSLEAGTSYHRRFAATVDEARRPMPSYESCLPPACLLFGRRSDMAATDLPCALAASTSCNARCACLTGHCGQSAAMAARMCFGTPPIGASPSQHDARHSAVRNRGALHAHRMQNSTRPATRQACSRKGLRRRLTGTGGGPPPPSPSPVRSAAAAPSAGASAAAGSTAAAAASPAGRCTALAWACIA